MPRNLFRSIQSFPGIMGLVFLTASTCALLQGFPEHGPVVAEGRVVQSSISNYSPFCQDCLHVRFESGDMLGTTYPRGAAPRLREGSYYRVVRRGEEYRFILEE